jgi:hypothetical protein
MKEIYSLESRRENLGTKFGGWEINAEVRQKEEEGSEKGKEDEQMRE